MNIKLILKFKDLFDYWLNSGTLLVSDKYEKRWITLTENIWLNGSSEDLLIIRDDEYVELRKALAEGKIIQYSPANCETWIDLDSNAKINFRWSLQNYRIKPEKFFYKVDILCQNGIEAQVIYQHSEQIIGKYIYVIVEYNGYNRIGRINTLISEPKFSCEDILSCINLKELKLE